MVVAVVAMMLFPATGLGEVTAVGSEAASSSLEETPEGSKVQKLWESTGIHGFLHGGWKNLIMVFVGLLLIYLGIAKKFEPLLLIPIGFGGLLANIPYAGIAELSQGGFLALIFDVGITSGVFPLLIFMGVGAMTDFGPLLANPKTALLGAAAQLGIFSTLIGALALSGAFEAIDFSIQDATYTKLREVTLSYRLDGSTINSKAIGGITLYATARNLFNWNKISLIKTIH